MRRTAAALLCALMLLGISACGAQAPELSLPEPEAAQTPAAPEPTPEPTPEPLVPYEGEIRHIFFHSLIVYPEMVFTDRETPYTRIIEHKHFEFGQQPATVISREYPQSWHQGIEPYYPMEDEGNRTRYERYRELAEREEKVRFGGRLGEYRYYDMQDTVKSALAKCDEWLR